MSNPIFLEDTNEILEGFLCPICKQDLKSPERLTNHVETLHAEEQDLLQSLKDIFSIARKKIYKNIDDTVDLARNFDTTLKPNNLYIPSKRLQEIGSDCDHIAYFKAIRSPRLERYATETNKLIIRLDKILKDLPKDPVKRRQHEQEKVPWLDGKSVNLCPVCAKNFHFARRQHHCRLCGSIMCHDCSCFLEINEAINLVNPSTMSSISPIESPSNKEPDTLRVCEHCLHLLDNRKDMQDSRIYRPTICKYYENIQEIKKQINPDIPTYIKMIKSLYEGDSIFTIADAGALRGKIGRVAETIDSLSKSIMSIPCPQGSREEALKKSIRASCIRFIKEDMLEIPPLPLEEEIIKLQEKRRRDTELRIERERRLALEAFEKYELVGYPASASSINSMNKGASGSALASLDNWSGHQADTSSSTDPLVEQINIIKGYIKQARQAMRFEEIETLENNLRELQQEFYQRQQS